jgi:hypothetical protein
MPAASMQRWMPVRLGFRKVMTRSVISDDDQISDQRCQFTRWSPRSKAPLAQSTASLDPCNLADGSKRGTEAGYVGSRGHLSGEARRQRRGVAIGGREQGKEGAREDVMREGGSTPVSSSSSLQGSSNSEEIKCHTCTPTAKPAAE